MPRTFSRLVIAVVVFGVAIGASFGAGTVYGRNTAAKSAPAVVANGFGQGAGASGRTANASGQGTSGSGAAGSGTPAAGTGQAGNGAARGRGGFINGTIQSIDGQTLTLDTQFGGQITVDLGSSTTVGTISSGDKSALKTGDTVLVSGQRGTDGTLTATSVVIIPAGFTSTGQ